MLKLINKKRKDKRLNKNLQRFNNKFFQDLSIIKLTLENLQRMKRKIKRKEKDYLTKLPL